MNLLHLLHNILPNLEKMKYTLLNDRLVLQYRLGSTYHISNVFKSQKVQIHLLKFQIIYQILSGYI